MSAALSSSGCERARQRSCQDALGHEVQDRLAVEPPLQVDLCGQAVAEVHPDEVAQVELLDCRICGRQVAAGAEPVMVAVAPVGAVQVGHRGEVGPGDIWAASVGPKVTQ